MCNNTAMIAELADNPGMTPDEEAFAGELLDTINKASAALMISVGYRAGLFDAMHDGVARTSEELAALADCDERYVREWLGAMTTARIVKLDRATRTYRLPSAHAALLGDSAEQGNMASMFQFIAVLGDVESRIVDCFRTGGGVPYEAYDRFHEVMAEESDATVVAGLEEHIIPLAADCSASSSGESRSPISAAGRGAR